ncbi:MAG TPA: beta-ketoacyl synthase N-terminal-like domain-containing protein [Flavobacteriales bacterium]|nr:beta-ketoacyl synthase N-terminal-like domain-containing protein [Flavobacteriales bacterium]
MRVVLGSAHVVSPLGEGLTASVQRMREGGTALQHIAPSDGPAAVVGKIPEELLAPGPDRLYHLVDRVLGNVLDDLDRPQLNERWGCYIASTKGDIEALASADPDHARLPFLADHIQRKAGFTQRPWIISNACASGTSAIAIAGAAIARGHIDHAIVLGVDVLSRFVLRGFQALHAVSEAPCIPFDAARNGTSLGEACAAVVLTNDPAILKNKLGTFLGGSIAHDANHISGPSRTGEGLVRAIQGACDKAGIKASDIHAINAHGTGTDYNDGMESIAFERCELSAVPMSGYKGWFGHTLGAAGILESILALEALDRGWVLRNEGLVNAGVPGKVNALLKDERTTGDLLLKTSSGFGGCNAAVLLRAWKP